MSPETFIAIWIADPERERAMAQLQTVLREAVKAEREACAKVADYYASVTAHRIAKAIRERDE